MNIASIPDRAQMLKTVVASLYNQCDELNLMLNGYTAPPEWVAFFDKRKLHTYLLDNSLGDGAKFLHADEGYILTCDDDLAYPSDYAARMCIAARDYNGITSLHGKKIIDLPMTLYHGKKHLQGYRCIGYVAEDVQVDIPGTGVMCYHTDRFKPDLTRFERRNMADVWIAIQAREQQVPIIVLAHELDYLTYLNPKGTIWEANCTNEEMDAFMCLQLNKVFHAGG